ncbi:MAG TPA: divergent polysaccharide deacetylase family protein, partial [Desulfobacteraceae bacterium]|nr:divergent polysaccharide deacetylase family protein [Desulfobacteraceae bacterium]
MAAKKRRKKGGGNPSGRKFIPILLVLGLGITFSAALVYHFFPDNPRDAVSPVFEEIFSRTSTLQNEIGHIEGVIYRCLYQGGIPERHVRFLSVEPQYQRGRHWDFTELLIHLPRGGDITALKDQLRQALGALGPAVTFRAEESSANEILYHVFAQDCYTHRIWIKSNDAPRGKDGHFPKIAIIIDDLGHDLGLLDEFFRLKLPLSLSVLPRSSHTAEIAEIGRRKGYELMLHLPMEPKNFPRLDPGPGALFADMSPEEIRDVVSFLDWVGDIDLNGWPPRPILVAGVAVRGMPGVSGTGTSDQAVVRGLDLFHGRGGCAGCHALTPGLTLVGSSLYGIPERAAERIRSADYQ